MICSGCTASSATKDPALNSSTMKNSNSGKHSLEENGEVAVMNIMIEKKPFQIELESNQATKKLIARLPLNLKMNDLHGNEKYAYLLETLPTEIEQVNEIEKGDVMLFGSDCLVLFYQTFSTNYSYTKIGKVKEADQLDFISELEAINVVLTP
ncbi:hypothetical protein RV15_GL001475 [Enterococcus silesiacus]|uniref:Cyclophilin-like domain-containing protein n=2 Tax=Enterococcus silesiacus TaxID=332949 RepID=A0AA91GG85_9ENTE|nr:cyclophilin-like fold protein [Enterococcus silesiacus]OJG90211.1 hypothetical protein RV15_GL001475 [Enterococcus silesiacus]